MVINNKDQDNIDELTLQLHLIFITLESLREEMLAIEENIGRCDRVKRAAKLKRYFEIKVEYDNVVSRYMIIREKLSEFD